MDLLKDRKGFAIKIMVTPDSVEKADKELDEEGQAPILKKVDGEEVEEKDDDIVEKVLMNGEDRMVQKNMEEGMSPTGLTQKIQAEIMKKKMSQKA